MKGKKDFFTIQCYISLFPFLGCIISLICTWYKIYKTTHSILPVVLHYLISIIPWVLTALLLSVLYFNFFVNLESTLRGILTFFVSYISIVMISLFLVLLGKRIINRYNKKHIM